MKHILCWLLVLYGTAATACDVCGASGSSQGLGILPQFYRHFAGVQYQYRSFSSTHPGLTEQSAREHTQEQYNTVQLWGRANVGKRLQLFAFVPFMSNTRHFEERNATSNYHGLGDVSALANVAIIKTADSNRVRHMLLAGAGIKAPTGKRYSQNAQTDDGILNIQPGTGSWDALLNANYTLRYALWGLNAEASYTLTTANKEDYKYGNRLGTSLQAFYWLRAGSFTILPQAGLRYEYTLHDYDNYTRKWLNEQTGGNMLFATAGAQVYYKQLGLQFSYFIPVHQYYAAGYVTAGQRIDAGIFFLF